MDHYAPANHGDVIITRNYVLKTLRDPTSWKSKKELDFAREAKRKKCSAAVKILSVTDDSIKMDHVLPINTVYGKLGNVTYDLESFRKKIHELQAKFYKCFGVYHCDPHGNNIAFDRYGRLVFIDFGVLCDTEYDAFTIHIYKKAFEPVEGKEQVTFNQMSRYVRKHFHELNTSPRAIDME